MVLAVGLISGVVLVLFRLQQKNPLSTPLVNQQESKQIIPSDTLKTYTDPSGFTFAYPDNLSLIRNEPANADTYADIKLTAKDIDGYLSLNISDSKFKSLDEWVKTTKSSQTPKEVKLGELKALEVSDNDKLLLAALDQGIIFSIEVSFDGKKDFWMKVYEKVIKDFSFASPSQEFTASQGVSSPSDDVTFEGEEVVE